MTTPRALVVALGLFTTIPMPVVTSVDRRLAGRAMAAFPVVGVVVGLAAAVVAWLAGWLGGAMLGGVLGLGTLAALTGALHLDGVADTADGLGSRRQAAEALEIMRRSDIGPMGVVTLVLVLLADVAALVRLDEVSPTMAPVALLAAAVLGRVAVVLATTASSRGARTGGFGALFDGVTSRTTALAWCLGAVVFAAALGWAGAGQTGAGFGGILGAGAILALAVAHGWRGHLARRLGGMTGDTFGSLVEVTQMVFFVLAALGAGIAP